MTVNDILEVCHGKLFMGDVNEPCFHFSKDTREIKPGDIYVGIRGENYDGNDFWKDAFEKGAKICLLEHFNITEEEKEIWSNRTVVLVEDTVLALQQLAHFKRSKYDIPVVAITGSVGKTSTKDMVASVLEKKYNVLKTQGNYNNNIGLPLTILDLDKHDCLVVEMGMSHANELSVLTNIASPTIAVITNIGSAHIGNLGSRENILKAKLEILDGLQKNGTLIINKDNDLLNKVYDDLKNDYSVVTVGTTDDCQYQATDIKEDIFSSQFTIGNLDVTVPVGGMPFIYNSLVAYAVGKQLNLSDLQIKEGIEQMSLSANRLEMSVINKNITLIDDTYNASYDSVKADIDLLDKISKRTILVFGDILELGDYSEEIHCKIGKDIAASSISFLITVGNKSKITANSALQSGFNIENQIHFSSQEEVYPFLKQFLTEDDVILLKASHGICLNQVANELKQMGMVK